MVAQHAWHEHPTFIDMALTCQDTLGRHFRPRLSSPKLPYMVIRVVLPNWPVVSANPLSPFQNLETTWIVFSGGSPLRNQFKCDPNVFTLTFSSDLVFFVPQSFGAHLSGHFSTSVINHKLIIVVLVFERFQSNTSRVPWDRVASNTTKRPIPSSFGSSRSRRLRPICDPSFDVDLPRFPRLSNAGPEVEAVHRRPTPVLAALLMPQLPPSFMEFTYSLIVGNVISFTSLNSCLIFVLTSQAKLLMESFIFGKPGLRLTVRSASIAFSESLAAALISCT